MGEETRLDIQFQNEVLAEKQKQREAWRTYAAAGLQAMDLAFMSREISIVEVASTFADAMLVEENKRFGGYDENL